MFGPIGLPETAIILVITAAALVIVVWPAARILQRAGFSRWLAIFPVVPLANICLLWFVALSPRHGSHRRGVQNV